MYQRIRDWLAENKAEFREVHHTPTLTSEEAAKARGEDISIGGKALLLKVDESYKLFVLSAARLLDSNAIKERFGAKRVRFATPDELKELTGLVPGSVPPFTKPFLELELYVDESIRKNDRIAFNAGSLTDSIVMGVADYMRLAQPAGVFGFSKEKK